MADTKISALTSATPIETDELVIVDDPGGTPSSKRITISALLTLIRTQLASTTNGEGASLIGVEDAGGLFSAADVEAILTEIGNELDTHGTVVTLDQSEVILTDGQDVVIFDAGGSSTATRPSAHPANKTVIWFNHGSSQPTNKGTYDIAVGGGFGVASVNSQTGTTYTLVLGDAGFNVDMNNASANTLTIPTNASVAFGVGTCIAVTMLGAGTTTITGATGVTVNGTSAGSVAINNQYSGCVIRKTATDTWVAQGDIT